MTENSDKKRKKLSLSSGKGTLSLKAPKEGSEASKKRSVAVRGRTSTRSVAVEVKKKRGAKAENLEKQGYDNDLHLTKAEHEARLRALENAQHSPKSKSTTEYQTKLVVKNYKNDDETSSDVNEEDNSLNKKSVAEISREEELAKLNKINKDTKDSLEKSRRDAPPTPKAKEDNVSHPPSEKTLTGRRHEAPKRGVGQEEAFKKPRLGANRAGQQRRRAGGKMTVQQAMNRGDGIGRTRSMAAQRRAREKQRLQQSAPVEQVKQYREVTLPEVITVQELSNRMTERVVDVVKKLMELGIMATGNQSIDADTAELIIGEFGHTFKRVLESDVELGEHSIEDKEENLKHRPPVVTIMGHVDHGKTSLLDAIRQTDVVKGEAGGITQHIGAYQITTKDNKKITFIDTPGHAAFTEMRARGADITDIVILVVAANDSVMPQTIEAINHAKFAKKPIIVAINKCDLPDANPEKVRQELLQHNVIVEQMSGDVQCVEVSALTRQGFEELEEAILMQAEMMNLRANPARSAIGSVVESRMVNGKGSVATILIQKGTLKHGDIFVTGAETGHVRALINDAGKKVKIAIPGEPIEVLGLNGTPEAGDDFLVVGDDAKAREIAEFRTRRKRALSAAKTKSGRGIEQMMSDIKAGLAENLPLIIKGDVHGSVEAISGSLNKVTEENTEVKVQILHTGVGAITESDVTLARASNCLIIGFNVRANAQARSLAKRDGVDIRYYSIIYQAIDDVKALLSGMLSPDIKEKFIGYAEIRKVFSTSKYGKISGCFITEGMVKRGAKVRLLRDNVVIHEGTLKTLRRFKEEVKEVKKGYECGMAFENYDDVKEGDVIEAFEMESTDRKLD